MTKTKQTRRPKYERARDKKSDAYLRCRTALQRLDYHSTKCGVIRLLLIDAGISINELRCNNLV